MIERDDSVVVTAFVRFLAPTVQLFGLYVLAHGHESPGGGFQAGVILGATYLAIALALGREALDRRVSERACLGLACGGIGLYVASEGVNAIGNVFLRSGVFDLADVNPEGVNTYERNRFGTTAFDYVP